MKLSQPNEPNIDLPSEELLGPSDGPGALGPADFRLIGLAPMETRLGVIRSAAVRATKPLASQQLAEPDPYTEQLLSRIAVSTYRLLDPRQREDQKSRADVGRIRPGTLYQVGHTRFAEGRLLAAKRPQKKQLASKRAGRGGRGTLPTPGDAAAKRAENPQQPSASANRPSDGDIAIAAQPIATRDNVAFARVRSQLHHPAIILAISVLLLLAAAVVWYWGQNLRTEYLRNFPFPQRR